MNTIATPIDQLLLKHPELQIPHDKYNINVTTENGNRLDRTALLREFELHDGAGNEAHLYFHLPLCNYICKFCNYVKRKAPTGEQLQVDLEFWVKAWQQEAGFYLKNFSWISKAPIHSVYLGGGTAALLQPAQLKSMIEFVTAHYNVQPGAEISLEGNPDNFTAEYIEAAVGLGFNRFSLGVQSLDDRVLQYSGRGHSAQMAVDSIEALVRTGLPFNVDIMFGLPHQTPETVESDVSRLIELGAPTITIYRLRNADREKMGIGNRSSWNNSGIRAKMEEQGLFPSLASTYEMRSRIVGQFMQAGYAPSPCGWWSKPGTYEGGNIPKVSKCKWENYNTMLAYGPGAYGWLTGDGSKAVQTHNLTDIHAYRTSITNGEVPLSHGKTLDGYASLATRLGFALKANQPVSEAVFAKRYNIELFEDDVTGPVLKDLIGKGLLERLSGGRFRLSADGETLHEEIISTYVHDRIGGFQGEVCRRTAGSHA